MRRREFGRAGFTLIETLLATALLLLILAMLASVTTQWLPNWNRGYVRAQRSEHLSLGIERIVADLSAVEFIPSAGELKRPIFDGTTLGITLVRTAIGPNTRRGVEFVRLAEVGDDSGPLLVRATAPFEPLATELGEINQLRFRDPVVLIRAPYRVQFFFAGPDRQWRASWQEAAALPSAVQISVRDNVTGQTLGISTATRLHVEIPAECAKNANPDCPVTRQPAANQTVPR